MELEVGGEMGGRDGPALLFVGWGPGQTQEDVTALISAHVEVLSVTAGQKSRRKGSKREWIVMVASAEGATRAIEQLHASFQMDCKVTVKLGNRGGSARAEPGLQGPTGQGAGQR